MGQLIPFPKAESMCIQLKCSLSIGPGIGMVPTGKVILYLAHIVYPFYTINHHYLKNPL